MKVILYSIGCPKCDVLKKKLIEKEVKFEECNSKKEMYELGFHEVPMLMVEEGIMDFYEAVKWINNQ